jgi:hypothetical protein
VVGSSQVVAQAQETVGLDIVAYPSQSAAMDAINQGKLYGAYISGSTSDTLIVVPTKSFFGEILLDGAFLPAAHQLKQPLTMEMAKPAERPRRGGGGAFVAAAAHRRVPGRRAGL